MMPTPQVLGTFITEWEAGQQTCEVLFESMESAEQAAKQLVAIARYFHFEGWLVNIENNLDESKVPHLLHFLRSGFCCFDLSQQAVCSGCTCG